MTSVSFHYITNFFSDEPKHVKRRENGFNSRHVMMAAFEPSLGHFHGNVQASMRDKSYDVKVVYLCFSNSSIYIKKLKYEKFI